MWQNSIVKNVFLFLGAFFALGFLRQIHGALAVIAVGLAGITAAVIWLRVHEPSRLFELSRHPLVSSFVSRVCRLARLQPPTPLTESPAAQTPAGAAPPPAGAGGVPNAEPTPLRSAPTLGNNPLLIKSDEDFSRALDLLKTSVRGQDGNVEAIWSLIRNNIRVRERSVRDAALPPICQALLVGGPGLGKLHLATAIGRLLYGPRNVVVIDLRERAEHAEALLEAVRANPYQTVILDNVDAANEVFLERLHRIVEKGSVQAGKSVTVDFRFTFLFLVVSRESEKLQALRQAIASQGMTMEMQAASAATSMDLLLTTLIGEIFYFDFPDETARIEVVTALMHEEAARASLDLTFVDPRVVYREVQDAARNRSFELVPARIANLLRPYIARAHAENRSHLDVLPEEPAAAPHLVGET